MIFRAPFLAGIAEGRITLAFRRWRRPTVRSGGTLNSAVGMIAILSVEPCSEAEIDDAAARAAGHPSRAALIGELAAIGTLYRIGLRFAGPDERAALRDPGLLGEGGLVALEDRLNRMDQAAKAGPWTWRLLELVHAHPARRAADLADMAGFETLGFKARMRRLKGLGLTESLETGYRLSATGAALWLAHTTSPRNHG
jgi:hypothetical protein